MNYDNEFKQEALKLSDEIGAKKAFTTFTDFCSQTLKELPY